MTLSNQPKLLRGRSRAPLTKWQRALPFASLLTLSLSTSSVAAPQDAVLAPDNGILLSIGQDVDSINDYVADVGVQPGGVVNYVGIADLDGLFNNADAGAGRNNVAELAATYPDSALIVGVSMNNQLDAVVAGAFNDNIDTLLNTLAGYDRPVYLRWAYEVDGVQWNVSHTPERIRDSFAYVRQRIDALGHTDTIALVWQVSSYCYNAYEDLNIWYPGNDVVDWIGLSYFSPQDCAGQSRVHQAADFARANGKPVFINESTPQRYDTEALTYSTDGAGGTNRQNLSAQQIWDQWYEGYFRFIEQEYPDVVKAITYINADWDSPEQYRWGGYTNGVFTGYTEGYWGDSRVQANATILENWLTRTNDATYLKLNAELYSQLDFGNTTDQPTDPVDPPPTDQPAEPTPRGELGIEYVDSDSLIVFHRDNGYTANWHYLCLDSVCYSGELVDGYYQRQFDGVTLGQSYQIQFKVQDNTLSQYISDTVTVTFSEASVPVDPTPDPEPPVDPDPVPPTDPDPVPPTEPDPVPPTTPGAPQSDFGIFYVDDDSLVVYHIDNGWTADWHYLCLDGGCYSGELVDGYYQRQFDSVVLGQTYNIQFKAQDDALSQFISDEVAVVFTAGDSSVPTDPDNPTDPQPPTEPTDPPPTTPTPPATIGGGTRVENDVVISDIAERYRVRHELSGNDFNNFNVEYWFARFGYFQLFDYTRPEALSQRQAACGTTEACVVVELTSAVPAAMTDSSGNEKDCNQQVPNWRYHKVYGDETNFLYGAVMQVRQGNDWVDACSASRDTRATATQWRTVMQYFPSISRPFAHGEQIEFEVTINFNRTQTVGDNVNYYGQTYRYILGEGFTVNNRDTAVGPTGINDAFAKLGGDTTIPHLSETGGTQTRLSFMQHAYNLAPNHVADWLAGRRLIHTDFVDGSHIEEFLPGPQALGGNLPFPELAGLASNPIQNSCTQCHTLNGAGDLQSGQDVVPPKMIGLGLLGGIPDTQIEQWALENGGTVNYVTLEGQQQIGRYGWDAGTASLKQQVAEALFTDMGVETGFDGFGVTAELSDEMLEQIVTYLKLVAVPTPRQNLTTMAGHQLFVDYGCADCHKPTAQTGDDGEFPELANQTIHPFTDLLLHDLGEGSFRTAPLWGIGLSGSVKDGNATTFNLMHDGASSTIDDAIQRHNGSASAAKDAYNSGNRQAIIDYLLAL